MCNPTIAIGYNIPVSTVRTMVDLTAIAIERMFKSSL